MVHMTAQMVLLRGQQTCKKWLAQPNFRLGLRISAYVGAGFFLSGGALGLQPQPFAIGAITALTGWRCAAAALGSMAGYLCFWGTAGTQGLLWALLGGLTGVLLGKRQITTEVPLLIPALCGLEIAAAGLLFQAMGWEDTALWIYLLRIGVGTAASGLFPLILKRSSPVADWLGVGIFVLALAQAAPFPWLNLGCIAAGAVALRDAFPAAALAGLALELSRVTKGDLTGVLCVIYLLRLIPGISERVLRLAPGAVYLLMMPLSGVWDVNPLPGLILGGLLSALIPRRGTLHIRRGETGMAQVRLELMAQVLSQTRQLLTEVQPPPIDGAVLMAKARERACGTCPNRKKCTVTEELPVSLLRKPLFDTTALPFPCRKPGRMITELRRTQERYRNLRADRERCREYRSATAQQYLFLSEYLRSQSDQLPKRGERKKIRYQIQVGLATTPKQEENGDKFLHFYGTEGNYYLLLCDGMGTGMGASDAGHTAAVLLQQMLSAGFPAEAAIQSLNSLLVLRGSPGAVTVDLAQISLVTGNVTLYKWGAAPSYLLRTGQSEKIGTASPPPGIGLEDTHMVEERLSLRGGEVLILVSDGVDGEKALCGCRNTALPPGELAAKLLEHGTGKISDDATVAISRLTPVRSST